MKIVKYSKESTTVSNISGGSAGGSSDDYPPTRGGGELDRTIWGLNDTGDDVDGSMTVNGNISIKVINYDWDDEEDDGDGEYEDYEEGGGNLDVELKITSKEVEAKDIYATRHLFINYPSHPDHPEDNKKCIGEIVKNVEDKILTNSDNIKVNKDAIEEIRNLLLPVGSIIMYNGVNPIPDNWKICDGNNGTPNLIGKFIKADKVAGNVGGNTEITLTVDNMPSHSHNLKVETDISNNSVIPEEYKSKYIQALDELYENSFDLGGSDHYVVETGYKNKSDKGLVGIKVGDLINSNQLNTTYSIESTGNGSSFNIEPSYYSLIYIMKIK